MGINNYSGMIWNLYDWLNKFYNITYHYTAALVGIITC